MIDGLIDRYINRDIYIQFHLLDVCVSFSVVSNPATIWTRALQAFLSMGFSRQEYWSGFPVPPAGNLSHPGIKPESPTVQADSYH